MGWGWGWPVDTYSQSSAANQDVNAQQHYSGKDVSQAGYTMYGNEFSAALGMEMQVGIRGSSSLPALRFWCLFLNLGLGNCRISELWFCWYSVFQMNCRYSQGSHIHRGSQIFIKLFFFASFVPDIHIKMVISFYMKTMYRYICYILFL